MIHFEKRIDFSLAIEKAGTPFHVALGKLLYSKMEPPNEDSFDFGALLGGAAGGGGGSEVLSSNTPSKL